MRHALAGAERAGLRPTLRVTNGGLDANWLVRHGVPTVTLGAGQRNVHTTEEFIELEDFLADRLGLPKSAVTLAAGATSRQKTLRIAGLTPDQLRARLAAGG